VTAGDIEGDGIVEVFALATQNNFIRVFNGQTGARIRDIGGAGYGFPYGGPSLFDLDEDGRLEIITTWKTSSSQAVRCFRAHDGTHWWSVDGGCAYGVADLNGDHAPEIVIERKPGSGSGTLTLGVYRYTGTHIRDIRSFSLNSFYFPHYGLPVIADFDHSTPEPEIAIAINHVVGCNGLVGVYMMDGTEIWRYCMSSGEFMSITAADLNCDQVPDIAAHNFDGNMFIFDGVDGTIWAHFTGARLQSNQDNNFVAIADLDLDFHSEFVNNGYTSPSTRNIIRVTGDDDRWNPTRPIWNENGFYHESIGDHLEIDGTYPAGRKYTNWREGDLNIFRCQKLMACGLGVLIDYDIECSGCLEYSNLTIDGTIFNTNSLVPAPGSQCSLAVILGNECLRLISGSYSRFLGLLHPRESTYVNWVFYVDSFCLHREVKIRIFAWSSDSEQISPTYYDFNIPLPICDDIPEARIIRPLPCGGIMTCADSIQQMLAFYVTSNYYPLDYDSLILAVEGDTYTISAFNLVKQGDNNIIYIPVPHFENGDTVFFRLVRVMNQEICCTASTPPCSVIIDLQPPILYDPFPSEGARIYFTPTEFRVHIIDSIAGVNWSTVDTAIAHVTSVVDTADIPVVRSGDTLLIVPLTSFTQAGTVTVCFSGIEDAPTILYCPPNVADTCFHYVVLSRFVALPLYPDSAKYNACQDGILKMLFAYHQFPIDLSTVRLRITQDEDTVVIPGSDPRMSIVGEDTLVFSPGIGFWRDGVKVTVCLDDARDIYGGELSNSPVCWWFWNDFSPPVAWMESPAEDDTTFNLLQEIVIGLYDSMAGVDTSKLIFWLNSDTFPDHSKLSWTYHSKRDTIYFIFAPRAFDYRYAQGDTIYVNVSICDTPDYCGPNCGDYLFRFFIGELHSCERFPNPFTPNADGVNDYVQFYYPDFFLEAGEILIFDSHERLVKRISVPTGGAAKVAARWDGTDEHGNPLPPGLYVYIITVRGELVCEGTVTLAR